MSKFEVGDVISSSEIDSRYLVCMGGKLIHLKSLCVQVASADSLSSFWKKVGTLKYEVVPDPIKVGDWVQYTGARVRVLTISKGKVLVGTTLLANEREWVVLQLEGEQRIVPLSEVTK